MLPHAPNLTKLLNLARQICQKENKPLTTTQLFGQILASDIKVQRILQKLNISWEKLKDMMIQSLPEAFPELFTEPFASKETKEVLDAAEVLAEKEKFVDVEHLLLAIIQGSTIRGWMDFADFPREEFEKEVQKLLDFSPVKKEEEEEKENGPPPNMMKYCLNLSAEAMMEGQKTFGREKEISEILDTIVREKKNNVLLIGENGVGRKSICRGVAERILSGRASEFSHKKALWKLDVTKLSSGSGMYGALESKISSLAAELDEDGDVILVIPDLHTTVGAGGKEGTVDIANLLKPILANPNVPVIGICTQAEYKKYLEKDSSLVNLFEIIRVDEPPEEETRKMIVRSLDSIQEHHLVKVDFAAVDEAISLCKRFLPYRKFPEKAFDVLDITCARKKNAAYVAPEELIKLEESVWDKIEDLASQGFSLEKGTPEYEKISKLEKKVAAKYKKWSENLAKNTPIVSAEDVVSTFVEKFKITENLINQESVQTSDLADRIRQEVHGQDQAVEAVCDVLVCSKAGLRDRTKPLAKFLFVGSSGVGKTMLGRKIAKYYFGDEKAILKLDMSEFQEKHSISSLTGAPPGYIGFDNGGKLTEYVKNNPSCVVLFDEIEKAHPDIANLLLQIMDDGCLTDSAGYRVDFTNTVVIITGNIGSGEKKTTMGFHNQMEEGENYKIALKKHFRPEFLNRLDDPIVFNELDEKTMLQILWDSLNTTVKNAAKQKIVLTVDQSFVDYLLKQAKNQDTHARNIQKLVEKNLNIPLSKRILKDKPKEITAKIKNEKLELV